MYVVVQVNALSNYALKPEVYGPFTDWKEAQDAAGDLSLIERGLYLIIKAKHITKPKEQKIKRKKVEQQARLDEFRRRQAANRPAPLV